jgi:rhodanese-related sulfurtransferase
VPISPSTLSFIQNNWAQILVLLVSGGMLIWPLVGKRFSAVKEVGTLQATRLINSEDAVLLDLREVKEYEGGRLPNATHIPLSQLASRGSELRKFTGRPVIAYCDRGNRSRLAKSVLKKLGFDQIYTLQGGIRAWREAGLPVEKS